MTTTSDQIAGRETSDGKEVAIDKDSDKSKLFRRKKGKKGLWRKSDGIDFVPALYGTLGLYLNFWAKLI